MSTLFLLPFGFKSPAWYDGIALAFAGAGNGIAQFWWTRSLSLAPPSSVVPFNYLSLVWATILGFAIWGDVPTPELLLGSAIVVASGLYILWRETMRWRKPPHPALSAFPQKRRSKSSPKRVRDPRCRGDD
jgi:drug/metabolite transporter (DMT)-like permease